MKILCCDIDGVLADCREYVTKYLSKEPKDWEHYFKHTREFPLIGPTRDMVVDLYRQEWVVLFVTGRPRTGLQQEDTRAWLQLHIPQVDTAGLLMRKPEDHRPAYKLKLEWYKQVQPDLILEDDPEVVSTASKEGFVVLQVHGFRVDITDQIPEVQS